MYLGICTRQPTGSPSHGGDVVVFVKDINQPSLPTPFYSLLISIFMTLSTVIHSNINPPNNSAFSLCSSSLILTYWAFQQCISLYNTTLLPSDKCTRNMLWYQAHSYTHSHQSHRKYVYNNKNIKVVPTVDLIRLKR